MVQVLSRPLRILIYCRRDICYIWYWLWYYSAIVEQLLDSLAVFVRFFRFFGRIIFSFRSTFSSFSRDIQRVLYFSFGPVVTHFAACGDEDFAQRDELVEQSFGLTKRAVQLTSEPPFIALDRAALVVDQVKDSRVGTTLLERELAVPLKRVAVVPTMIRHGTTAHAGVPSECGLG